MVGSMVELKVVKLEVMLVGLKVEHLAEQKVDKWGNEMVVWRVGAMADV